MTFVGAPRQVGPHVWTGLDLHVDPEQWMVTLTETQVSEIVSAAEQLVPIESSLELPNPSAFPLPNTRSSLDVVRHNLLAGPGFTLVRGLPIAELSPTTSAAAFLILGAHLGSLRSQNAAGHLLGHVRNQNLNADDPNVRIYQTSARQTFHTDSSDVVGLLCLETAAEGGASTLVSAATVYNAMLDRAPELAELLFRPIATDRRGEIPEGCDPYFEIPVLNWFDGQLTPIYQRQYIDSAQRFDGVDPLASEMIEALDLFDDIANDPDVHLAMDFEVGDMQFVHNHTLLHDRTAFVDKPDAPRHLLRLWLSLPGDRQLPPSFASRYGSLEVGNRGGIITDDRVELHAPIHPS